MKIYNLLVVSSLLIACTQQNTQPQLTNQQQSADELNKAIVYQVNVRQFSPEGNFRSIIQHLPRLKELGVDVLLLMPINPVGIKNRLGKLGNVRAVKDHYKVNPEFGNEEEFREFVNNAHEQNFKVVLDWEMTSTAWDHDLILEHPDWYMQDGQGHFVVLNASEMDKVMLNTNLPDVSSYLYKSMNYWVDSFKIDGFRIGNADVFGSQFWKMIRTDLSNENQLILMGSSLSDSIISQLTFVENSQLESQERQVFSGKKDANALRELLIKGNEKTIFYTSSDEINAHEGSVFDRLGKSAEMDLVLTYATKGNPMIYSGQEVGLSRSLSEVEKDQISWGDHPFNALYARLGKLRKNNPALWNDAEMELLATNRPNEITVIRRRKDGYEALALFNHSAEPVTFQLLSAGINGNYKSFKSRAGVTLSANESYSLSPWGYELFTASPAR